uniref:Reprolysin n=1 Tax=Rhipicephalus zambeziensis TaxID=60191 RepID=A0A224YP44_9ACAR
MFPRHIWFWMIVAAVSDEAQSYGDSVTVYPIVYEGREDNQRKVVVFDNEHPLELARASVLAPKVLLRDDTEDGVHERYVNGAHYERHLYGNAEHKASLVVKPQGRGRHLIAGLLNSTHQIKPIQNQIYGKRIIPHVISRIPTMQGEAHHKMLKVQARTNTNITLPDARMESVPLAVEVYLMSDYSHTRRLRKRALKALEYMMTYMYKVSLLLQQLKPPIRVALVAYHETNKKKADYTSFTYTGDLDADNTVTKLRQYAGKTPSVQKSDLVVLITASRMVDASAYVGAPEMLGIAPLEGICSQYSVAIVKDLAGRYTGVHSTAHEMGHSFGSYHDGEGTSTKCPAAEGYLMSPKSNGIHSEEFSACSHAVISKYINSEGGTCLKYAASENVLGVYPRSFQPPLHDNVTSHNKEESFYKVVRHNKL